jgi:hypothetical protein
MPKFYCDKCGEIDHVLMDGYAFGDRLLEGVMFEVRVGKKGLDVKVADDCEEYFSGLNTKKWLKAAKEHAQENDIATCPRCQEDVDAQPEEKD